MEFTDNSKKILRKFADATDLSLRVIGSVAEGYAKDGTPVVTGRLRNSITWAVKSNEGSIYRYSDKEGNEYSDMRGTGADEFSVYIGTNVEYAAGIELGTHRKAGAAHMLQRAATGHSNDYKKICERIFGNA